MVDEVPQQLVPQDFPNRELPTVEVGDPAIEIVVGQSLEPRRRLLVNPAIAGSKQGHFPGPPKIGRLILKTETIVLDCEAKAGVDFTEMPRQLSDRPAARVRPEIILVGWESLEEHNGPGALSIPARPDHVHLPLLCHVCLLHSRE